MICVLNKKNNRGMFRNSLLGIRVFCFSAFVTVVSSAPCVSGVDNVGPSNPTSDSSQGPVTTHVSFLIDPNNDANYQIACCGVIETAWFVTSAAGSLQLQVWDAGTGTVHTLLGSAPITAAAGDQTITLTSPISIDDGYRYGWYGDPNIIKHKDAGNSAPEKVDRFATTFRTTVGQTLDWSTNIGDFQGGQTYSPAIQLGLGPGSIPALTSSAGNTVTLNTADAASTVVTTITAADNDTGDVLSAITMDTNSLFTLTGGSVTTASSLAGITRNTILTFRVSDTCLNNGTLTVTVNIVNDPPTIHNLPASVVLSEDTTTETLLKTINVTDSVDTVTCSMDASTSSYPFTVKQIPGFLAYGIYSNANPAFNYDTTNYYTMLINCEDVDPANQQQKAFYVYLVKNQAPVITNLQGQTTVSTTTQNGDSVFTVSVTDAENDAITYTMSCPNDPTCPFQILSSGSIQLTADITTTTTTGYDIFVAVNDSKNTVTPKVLTVLIQDINDPVSISNLPISANYPVNENTAIQTPIFTVTSADQDTSQTLTYSMTSSSTGLTYFTINPTTGVISTSLSTTNYETLAAAGTTSFTLSVSVTDGVATDTEVLVVDIINLNEAPVFSQASYSLTANEGAADTVIGLPAYNVVDPDTGDTQLYDMNCPNGYFFMNSATGQVKFQADYDLDTGLATSVTCSLTVTDGGGLTDTATLIITIVDINDHTPNFYPSQYTFYTSYYSASGTVLGTISATDGDSAKYGTLVYSLDQTNLAEEFFSVDNNGIVTLAESLVNLGYGQSVVISGRVFDSGDLTDTASIRIIIGDTTTAAPTKTTQQYRRFEEDSRNMPWLVLSLLSLAVIGVLLAWVVYTCNGVNSISNTLKTCRRMRLRRPQLFRKKLPPPPPPPVYVDITIRKPPPPKRNLPWRGGNEGAPPGTFTTTQI